MNIMAEMTFDEGEKQISEQIALGRLMNEYKAARETAAGLRLEVDSLVRFLQWGRYRPDVALPGPHHLSVIKLSNDLQKADEDAAKLKETLDGMGYPQP